MFDNQQHQQKYIYNFSFFSLPITSTVKSINIFLTKENYLVQFTHFFLQLNFYSVNSDKKLYGDNLLYTFSLVNDYKIFVFSKK